MTSGSFKKFPGVADASGPDGKTGGHRPQKKIEQSVDMLLTDRGKNQRVRRGPAACFGTLSDAVYFGKKLLQPFGDEGRRAGGTGGEKFQAFRFFVQRIRAGLIGGNRGDSGKREAFGEVAGTGIDEARGETITGVSCRVGGKYRGDARSPGAEKRGGRIKQFREIKGRPLDAGSGEREFPTVDGSGEFAPGSAGVAVGDERKIVGTGTGENVSKINVMHVGHGERFRILRRMSHSPAKRQPMRT